MTDCFSFEHEIIPTSVSIPVTNCYSPILNGLL